MSFPKYLQYRRSDAPWIGDVPAHWRIAALRWLARRYAGGTPDKGNPDYWTDGTIPWLNSGSVNQRLITEASEYITEDAYAKSSARWVPKGALVMALAGQGKTKGMVAQLAIRATCNQSMAAIVPTAEVHSRYMYWWLDAQYQSIRNMAGGDLRDGLNLELLGQILCPLPAANEQASIASFLDRETAKIDALVAEQERLIELLEEKRQAVISHAVTKGLDPTAPMKESGVPWLGHVPAHWAVTRIKHRIATTSGGTPSTAQFGTYYTDDSGIPWVRTTDLKNGPVETVEFHITEKAIADTACKVLPGSTVLIAMYGGDGTIGKNGILKFPAAINQAVCGLMPSPYLAPEFLFWYIQFYRPNWMIGAESSRNDPNISQQLIQNAPLLVPPYPEQLDIAYWLGGELDRFDELTRAATHAADILRERRSALISAAVTGQIDVRQLEAA